MSNPFQTVIYEDHLKKGEKIKDGKEELTIEKPVGKDKYLVKAKEPVEEKQIDEISMKVAGDVAHARRTQADTDPSKKAKADKAQQSFHKRMFRDIYKDKSQADINKGYASDADANTKRGWSNESVHMEKENNFDQLIELSKNTLASYYSKAIGDRHTKELARDSAKRRGDEDSAKNLGDKAYNRSVGLEKAKQKFFAKEETQIEEVEKIDELSKSTLGSYIKKASFSLGQTGIDVGKSNSVKDWLPKTKKMNKRTDSIIKATDRLTKEDVDQVEESSYQGKGNHRPGWMLRADPELAKKVKEKIDLAKKRQKAYGDPSKGISVKENVYPTDEDIDGILELSSELLASYKKKASASATDADSKGDYKKGDKRFSGIIKATKKQLANDIKNHK